MDAMWFFMIWLYPRNANVPVISGPYPSQAVCESVSVQMGARLSLEHDTSRLFGKPFQFNPCFVIDTATEKKPK